MRRRAIIIGAAGALLPGAALAQFGFDGQRMADGVSYSLWAGTLGAVWTLDRTLLSLAYQLDQLRSWIVDTAFAGLFDALVQQIAAPLLLPLATLALLLCCAAVLLLPLTGRVAAGDVRQILAIALLAPLIFALGGPLLRDAEHLRRDIGGSIALASRQTLPAGLLGARDGGSGGRMAPPTPLYRADRQICGQMMARAGGTEGALRMDDLAAAALWADARDIQCPTKNLPDAFFIAEPEGPGYAVADNALDGMSAAERSAQIVRTQQGVTRAVLGAIPAALSAMESAIQLLFALALVVVWATLPLTLLLLLFVNNAGPLMQLIGQTVGIMRTSWAASAVLGLVFAATSATADLGNAAAFIGMSIAGLVLAWAMAGTALTTLRQSMLSFGIAASGGSALGGETERAVSGAARSGRRASHTALRGGGRTLRGGGRMGWGMARRAIGAHRDRTADNGRDDAGDQTYTPGTIRPIARLGEVAERMGSGASAALATRDTASSGGGGVGAMNLAAQQRASGGAINLAGQQRASGADRQARTRNHGPERHTRERPTGVGAATDAGSKTAARPMPAQPAARRRTGPLRWADVRWPVPRGDETAGSANDARGAQSGGTRAGREMRREAGRGKQTREATDQPQARRTRRLRPLSRGVSAWGIAPPGQPLERASAAPAPLALPAPRPRLTIRRGSRRPRAKLAPRPAPALRVAARATAQPPPRTPAHRTDLSRGGES